MLRNLPKKLAHLSGIAHFINKLNSTGLKRPEVPEFDDRRIRIFRVPQLSLRKFTDHDYISVGRLIEKELPGAQVIYCYEAEDERAFHYVVFSPEFQTVGLPIGGEAPWNKIPITDVKLNASMQSIIQ